MKNYAILGIAISVLATWVLAQEASLKRNLPDPEHLGKMNAPAASVPTRAPVSLSSQVFEMAPGVYGQTLQYMGKYKILDTTNNVVCYVTETGTSCLKVDRVQRPPN